MSPRAMVNIIPLPSPHFFCFFSSKNPTAPSLPSASPRTPQPKTRQPQNMLPLIFFYLPSHVFYPTGCFFSPPPTALYFLSSRSPHTSLSLIPSGGPQSSISGWQTQELIRNKRNKKRKKKKPPAKGGLQFYNMILFFKIIEIIFKKDS